MAKIANSRPGVSTTQPNFSAPLLTAPGKSPSNINRTFAPIIGAPPTGLDKIELYLPLEAVKVKDARRAGIRWSTDRDYDLDGQPLKDLPYLLTDRNGQPVHAWSGKVHTPGVASHISCNQFGWKISCNPSKHTPTAGTLLTSTSADLDRYFDLLNGELLERGLEPDFSAAKTYRLDLTRDAQLSQPFDLFTPVYSALPMKRASKKGLYDNGFIHGKAALTLLFYHKTIEANLTQPNLARAELQLINKGKGKANLLTAAGLHTFDGLRAVGFDFLNDLYRDTQRSQLFTSKHLHQIDNLRPLHAANLDARLDLLEEAGVNRRSLARRFLEINSDALSTYTLDEIVEAFARRGLHRNRLRDLRNRLRDNIALAARLHTTKGVGKLYRELYLKFAS